LRKFVLAILCGLFFTSCSQKDESNSSLLDDSNVDSLLSKANNYNYDKKTRLGNASKASDIIYGKKNITQTREYLFKLAGRYYNLEEYEKYIKVCRDVYKMARVSKDTLAIAKSLHYIGDYHYNKFKNDSAYYYYSKAEKTYLNLNREENIFELNLYKAKILFYEKDFSGCETAIVALLKKVKKKNDTRLIYECYITLGDALEGLNNNEQALEYYNKAYEVTKNLKKDPQHLLLQAQTYNYIGRVYIKKKEYNKAIYYFDKALNFENFRNSEPLMYANLINNKGYSKLKLGERSALFLLNEALEIRDSLDNIPGIVSSKINLSEYYLIQNDSLNAFLNGKEAQEMARVSKIYEDELKAFELLAKIDPKNDTFYNDRFIKLTDSLQNNERAIRNKFARIEFETDEILNQKNNIEAEKNKISSQRWIILGFSLFFILIIVLLYITKLQHAKNKELQYEQEQQKANEEIYQLMLSQQSKIDEGRQNEKKRIAQELHDGIMSKLTSTRLNLFILSKKTDEETIKKCLSHIDNIQNIEKEIRSIAHDLNKDIFSGKDSFKTMMFALFENQKIISEVNCDIEIDETINWESVENTTKINLYRIFQESLQNIHKYAKAQNVWAKITQNENDIHVEIKDDGVGFNVQKTKEGIGLKNMQSRIKMINGEINISSSKGKGTKINLIIPT